MPSVDSNSIRQMNEKLVKETIIEFGPLSRADISRKINLNKASVSSIVAILIEKNLVKELGSGESTNGRKPILVSLNEKCGISISIDIIENNIMSSAFFMDGSFILEKEITNIKIENSSIYSVIKTLIDEYILLLPKTDYGIIGITISIHGIVFNDEIVFSPFYNIENTNLKADLEKTFLFPIFIENEANLSVLGEKFIRSSTSNIICISIYGSGIGAGIIFNNTLFRGDSHYAGEIGHIVIDFNGKKCNCGNKGCIEQYASETNLLKSYSEKIKVPFVSFEKFKQDYDSGVPESINTINDFIYYISIIINNLSLTLSPNLIIINSNFTNKIDGILEKIKNNLPCKTISKLELDSSATGIKSILIGGFLLNRNEFLKVYESRS